MKFLIIAALLVTLANGDNLWHGPSVYCQSLNEVYWRDRHLCVSPKLYEILTPHYSHSVGFYSEGQSSEPTIILPSYRISANRKHNDTLDITYKEMKDDKIKKVSVKCIEGYYVNATTLKCEPNATITYFGGIIDKYNNNKKFEIEEKTEIEKGKKVICYVSNWAHYHTKFQMEQIPTDLCTHIMYAFFPLNDEGEVKLSDGWADISPTVNLIERTVKLLGKGAVEHVILSVGGWTYSGPDRRSWFEIDDLTYTQHSNTKPFQDIWRDMMSTEANREVFIKSLDRIVKKFGFTGVELDLEYPSCPQGVCSNNYKTEKYDFVLLLSEMRAHFGPKFHISIAASANTGSITNLGPNMNKVSYYVDFISVMTYDYYVYLGNGGVMGHNQPKRNVSESMNYYIKTLNIEPSKILIGVSLYGRGYVLDRENLKSSIKHNRFDGVGPVKGPSSAFEFSQQASVATIRELCRLPFCKNDKLKSLTTTTDLYDDTCCSRKCLLQKLFNAVLDAKEYDYGRCIHNSYYSFHDLSSWLVLQTENSAIAYTDVNDMLDLRRISDYHKLGGYLVYAIDQEDFDGSCDLPGGSYPFLRALITGKNLPNMHNSSFNFLFNENLFGDNVVDNGNDGDSEESGEEGCGHNGDGNDQGIVDGSGGGSGGGNDNVEPWNKCLSKKCRITGYGRNYCDCHKYYQCIKDVRDSTKIFSYEMTCPSNLVFNENIYACDWRENVDTSNVPCS
nr:chitinase [Apis mellifera nudivirus]